MKRGKHGKGYPEESAEFMFITVDGLVGRFGSVTDVLQCIAEVGSYPYKNEEGEVKLAPADWIKSIRQKERALLAYHTDEGAYELPKTLLEKAKWNTILNEMFPPQE